ncbi:MAG: hypothetical protein D6710_08005 [Nitrospirae bacterium]|nr:MAG: hypothetical protein D6710_08005 [Nitrospirota bacterium]
MSEIKSINVIRYLLQLIDGRVKASGFDEALKELLRKLYEENRERYKEEGEIKSFEDYLESKETFMHLKDGHALRADAYVVDTERKEVILYLIDCRPRGLSIEKIRGVVELAKVLDEDIRCPVRLYVADCYGGIREIDYDVLHDAFMLEEANRIKEGRGE